MRIFCVSGNKIGRKLGGFSVEVSDFEVELGILCEYICVVYEW